MRGVWLEALDYKVRMRMVARLATSGDALAYVHEARLRAELEPDANRKKAC